MLIVISHCRSQFKRFWGILGLIFRNLICHRNLWQGCSRGHSDSGIWERTPSFPCVFIKEKIGPKIDKFPNRNQERPVVGLQSFTQIVQKILLKILKQNTIIQHNQDLTFYLVRYKNKVVDHNDWLPAEKVPDAKDTVRAFRASERGYVLWKTPWSLLMVGNSSHWALSLQPLGFISIKFPNPRLSFKIYNHTIQHMHLNHMRELPVKSEHHCISQPQVKPHEKGNSFKVTCGKYMLGAYTGTFGTNSSLPFLHTLTPH